jgi:hypothetical protein
LHTYLQLEANRDEVEEEGGEKKEVVVQ